MATRRVFVGPILIAALFAVFSCVPWAAAADSQVWLAARGTPANTGAADAEGPATLTILWHVELPEPATLPAVTGLEGQLFVASGSRLFSFTSDGTGLWELDMGDCAVAMASSPSGTVHLGLSLGHLCAVSASGTMLWAQRVKVTGGLYALEDGTVIAGGEEAVVATDPGGERRWEYRVLPDCFT
ncbi:MAG: PQQ-binding-like beta-propeller repeat protein [Firmicutes bacterium]|nr:PQQ-binding-like beta-propeller repeat protein [Bacillota bacterium]